ncbi:MAG: Gfo/Idh/MocA family oxidoreductase [Reichenbachiella sp.]|uniref:Gfo/Idh/MocA family protein n=1 Tax=Reichenbachiella sp. TaxID=2184521 RepID=UPI0032648390
MENKVSRRKFIKKTALAGSGALALGSLQMPAYSYAKILGANDRINFGVVGMNGRGIQHINMAAKAKNTAIRYLCDVDSRVLERANKMTLELTGKKANPIEDFRELLEKKDLDAIMVATPEHWHAPMGIMGMQAGKHVYLEKPSSHNPREGEMLVQVQQSTGKTLQIGTQQRSAPTSFQAVKDIRDGIIGKAYMGKAWYSNKRGSIGIGKLASIPNWLNWELWQGPAPRTAYKDNIVHYNWHWFERWGTGEIHNNGTHEIDICRWALGVDYPARVTSSGGRYHFQDDWEFYDSQMANFEFEGGKMISWEGRSCAPFKHHGRGRGVTIHGTAGTILLDRNEYIAYDMDNNIIKKMAEDEISATTDTVGAGGLDDFHINNFLESIRSGAPLNAPIQDAHKTNVLCHLGNISQKVGRSLNIDTSNGKILNDEEAMKSWSRSYEKGWEPKS